MDQSCFFTNGYSLFNKPDEENRGWQQLSFQTKQQWEKDEFLNKSGVLSLPPDLPDENYKQFDEYPDERNDTKTQFPQSSSCSRTDITDFLSAIPYARSSYTVRRMNYEDDTTDVPNNDVQKTKTYFPSEFVGHASRESTLQGEETSKMANPTMVTGHALRRPEVNGSAFQSFTTQYDSPLYGGTRTGKIKSKKRSNRQFALEKHIEQIRRKHAEFNWDIPVTENKFEKKFQGNTDPSRDTDYQRVPSSPFPERQPSPSLYSLSDTPLIPVFWMQSRGETGENVGTETTDTQVTDQRYTREGSTNNEYWSVNNPQDCSWKVYNEAKKFHLYPY